MMRCLVAAGALAVLAGSVCAQERAPAPPNQPKAGQAQNAPPAARGGAGNNQQAQMQAARTLYLVRSVLLALHQANQTGNYSVLRDMSAPSFQAVNSPARLSEIFAEHRARKFDLAAVAVTEPKLSRAFVDQKGMLLIAGTFPATQPPVNFQLLFVSVEGLWSLFGISVSSAPDAASQSVKPAPTPPKP